MEVLIKNQTVKTILETIGEEYRNLFPEDYENFMRYVKEENKNLIKSSGMSNDGHILNLMKIPAIHTKDGRIGNLYSFIKQQMYKRCGIKDFFADRKNYRLLCEVWQDAEIKRKPTQTLDLGAIKSNVKQRDLHLLNS